MTWHASVLTLFPAMFPGPLGQSLAGRALESGVWSLDVTNIRDFAADRHRTVDDTPFGGGAGMVLRPDIVDAAVDSVADGRPIVCLTPRGRRFTQADAQRFAAGSGDHPAVRPLRRHRSAGHRGTRRWMKSASATMCCRAANWRRWCCWTASCGCCPG